MPDWVLYRGRLRAALRASSDERLAALAGDQDRAAFEELYDRYHQGVFSFCRQMLGRREDAEDALQQTFLAAYRALGRGATPDRFRAWLYAAARNHCLSVLERRVEEMLPDDFEAETEALPVVVERRHDLRQMLADMARLPATQRAALTLSTLKPMRHDEIAEVLGCKREDVKALIFRARTSLADSKRGREAPCDEIRELLARSRRGALRRTVIRRHLRSCPSCREFRAELRRQREAAALLVFLVPGSDVKQRVMEAAFGPGAVGGAAGVGAGAVALGHKGAAALTAAVVFGAATGGAALLSGSSGGQRAIGSLAQTASPAAARLLPDHAALGSPAPPLFGALPAAAGGDGRAPERPPEDERRAPAGGAAAPSADPGLTLPAPEPPPPPAAGAPELALPESPADELPDAAAPPGVAPPPGTTDVAPPVAPPPLPEAPDAGPAPPELPAPPAGLPGLRQPGP